VVVLGMCALVCVELLLFSLVSPFPQPSRARERACPLSLTAASPRTWRLWQKTSSCRTWCVWRSVFSSAHAPRLFFFPCLLFPSPAIASVFGVGLRSVFLF
jgi:hypothetical protein